MTERDDDLRAVFDAAHEAPPPIERVLAAQPRGRRVAPVVVVTAVATAVTIIALVVAWPARAPSRGSSPPEGGAPQGAEVALDLSAAELRATTIVTPLDSLLDVPGLAPLHSLPELGRVPTVSDPGGVQ